MKNGINFLHLPVLKLKEAIYIIYASFEISPFKNNSSFFNFIRLFATFYNKTCNSNSYSNFISSSPI